MECKDEEQSGEECAAFMASHKVVTVVFRR